MARKENTIDSERLWHKRFGHLNMQSLKNLQKHKMVQGLPRLDDVNEVCCEGCALGKQYREFFETGKAWRAAEPLELIHTDVYDPMKNASISGNKYYF